MKPTSAPESVQSSALGTVLHAAGRLSGKLYGNIRAGIRALTAPCEKSSALPEDIYTVPAVFRRHPDRNMRYFDSPGSKTS